MPIIPWGLLTCQRERKDWIVKMFLFPRLQMFILWEKGLSSFSTEMSLQEMLYTFLILNDSTCQFYYMERIRKVAGW